AVLVMKILLVCNNLPEKRGGTPVRCATRAVYPPGHSPSPSPAEAPAHYFAPRRRLCTCHQQKNPHPPAQLLPLSGGGRVGVLPQSRNAPPTHRVIPAKAGTPVQREYPLTRE